MYVEYSAQNFVHRKSVETSMVSIYPYAYDDESLHQLQVKLTSKFLELQSRGWNTIWGYLIPILKILLIGYIWEVRKGNVGCKTQIRHCYELLVRLKFGS